MFCFSVKITSSNTVHGVIVSNIDAYSMTRGDTGCTQRQYSKGINILHTGSAEYIYSCFQNSYTGCHQDTGLTGMGADHNLSDIAWRNCESQHGSESKLKKFLKQNYNNIIVNLTIVDNITLNKIQTCFKTQTISSNFNNI